MRVINVKHKGINHYINVVLPREDKKAINKESASTTHHAGAQLSIAYTHNLKVKAEQNIYSF